MVSSDVFLHLNPDGTAAWAALDWDSPVLGVIAAQYSDVLKCEVRVLAGDDETAAFRHGFRVKTAGGYHADVYGMLVNWRLALVPVETPVPVARRYWCYAGRGGETLALALASAALWDGTEDWEPSGFERAWNRPES